MGISEHPHLDPSSKPHSGREPSAQHTEVTSLLCDSFQFHSTHPAKTHEMARWPTSRWGARDFCCHGALR